MFLRMRIIIGLLIVFSSLNLMAKKKAEKSNDIVAMKTKANDYYDKKKYDKAIPIYETLLTVLKGQQSVEDIYFKYSKAQYLSGSYELGAFYLKSFYTTYYNSPYTEEASYLEALCYYEQSPRYSLEQTNTDLAIGIFQNFINKYPKSIYVQEANTKMDELRAKLRKKSYEAAYLYYKIGQYNAAVVALKNFASDYPEYEDLERIDYLILKSYKNYADQSYILKKRERYTDEIKAYEAFKSKYPSSKYLTELEKDYQSALLNIEKLKKDNL